MARGCAEFPRARASGLSSKGLALQGLSHKSKDDKNAFSPSF